MVKCKFHLIYSKHEKNEIVRVYGYPEKIQGNAIKTSSFKCKCDLEFEKDVSFRIISENPLFTFNNSTADNVIGFSGSGLFLEEDDTIILKGIFPELNFSDGAFNALVAYQIECFDEIIAQNGLHELMPEFLLNFNNFKELAFYSVEPHISNIIRDSLEKIVKSNISPKQIANIYKGSLYVPYTEKYKNKLANKNLWKGWLELLTVLSILAENNDDSIDDNKLLNSYLNKVNLLFSVDEPALSVIIQKLIVDENLKKLLIDDVCIVINSTIEPAKRVYSKRRIQKILPNISRSSQFTRGLMISDPTINYSFSCLHLSHFLNKIGMIDQDIDEETPIDLDHIRDIIQKIMKELDD